MLKNILWLLIFIIPIIFMFIFMNGFISSINISSSEIVEDAETDDLNLDELEEAIDLGENNYNILVLGDSIGEGAGDEEGLGIGKRYSNYLKEVTEFDIQVTNLSSSGDKTEDLLKLINNNVNSDLIKNSDLIILSIGGNDMKQLLDEPEDTIYFKYSELSIKYLDELKQVIDLILDNNADCQIAMLGLYNPYGDNIRLERLQLFLDWNYQTQLLISQYENAVFVPTYDLFKYNLKSYLFIDDFHPNSKGYEAIAKRLFQVLNNFE